MITPHILFVSNVGSHLWGMEKADSDRDLFECFLAPSREILLGRIPKSQHLIAQRGLDGHPLPESEDRARHELGKVCQMLLEGNVNFLWGTFSPLTSGGIDGFDLQGLRDATISNLSAKIYGSIHGLGFQNYKKYVQSGKDVSVKRMSLIGRTLRFGASLLRTGKFRFDSVWVQTPDELVALLSELDDAMEATHLPPVPTKPMIMWDFLLQERLRDLGIV